MSIGSKLKKLRNENKLTLKDLAEKTELSISFLSDIENGRRMPRIENLNKIAEALNVDSSTLLGGTESLMVKESSDEYSVDELEIEFERIKPKLKDLSAEEKDKLIKIISAFLEK